MSLSHRLSDSKPRRQNRGCETCKWLASIAEGDRQSIKEWVANGWSFRQLHELCVTDPDLPLPVSITAFKNHFRDCREK